jgi:hypothetical protein
VKRLEHVEYTMKVNSISKALKGYARLEEPPEERHGVNNVQPSVGLKKIAICFAFRTFLRVLPLHELAIRNEITNCFRV